MIHRDLKPENILVNERDGLVLSDFGIATMTQSSRSQNTQDIVGTAAYMAPEQLQGKPRPASDQYSFAIMVYEWLTGTRPFQGTFTEIASQHLLMPPPPLREKRADLPLAIEQVLMTALQKDPHQRFGSIKAFSVAFEQACEQGLRGVNENAIETQRMVWPPTGNPTPDPGNSPVPPIISVQSSYSQNTPPAAWPVSQPQPAISSGPVMTPDTSPVSSITSQPAVPYGSNLAPQRGTSGWKSKWLYGALAALVVIALAIIIPAVSSTGFHQTIVTSPDITSIRVGTGYTKGIYPDGMGTTFHSGDTLYLVCDGKQAGNTIADTLTVGNTTVNTGGGTVDVTDVVYYDYATVSATGVYTWVVNYTSPSGTPEQASITFQVV